MSKLFSHLETKHQLKPLAGYTSLGQEFCFRTRTKGRGFFPLGKVNNDLEFIVNRESDSERIVMFWISLNRSAKEAKKYEYTLKLWNKDRTKILIMKSTECLSTVMPHDNVKRMATALFLTQDDVKKAETDDKKLWWRVSIKKK